MENEPERPIEKLLRQAAQKRRDEAGAPFELHPVNRRLLQGEVARNFARPQRERRSFAVALAQLWPRLAGGLALFAVLCLAVWVLLPVPGSNEPEASLARNLPVPEAVPAKEPLPLATPAPTTIAPQPGPGVKTESPMLAYADKVQPSPATSPGQVALTVSPGPESSAVALLQSQDATKLAPATAPSLADQQADAKPQLVASAGTSAQTPAGAANGIVARRYALAGQPAPSTSSPTGPAVPSTVALTPPPANLVMADEPAKRVGDLSQQSLAAPGVVAERPAQLTSDKSDEAGTPFRSLAAVAPANRRSQSPIAADSLSNAAAEASQQAKALTVAQRFVQIASEAKAKDRLADRGAAAHPVLASFQVEQAGTVLRIVDGDGSVYTGSLQLAKAAQRLRAAKAETPAPALATRAPAGALELEAALGLDSDRLAEQNYSFRVAGTNQSLQKKVVFTGNLLTATGLILSLPSATNLTVGGVLVSGDRRAALSDGANKLNTGSAFGGFQNAPALPGFQPLLHSRISGKLVIGSAKAVEINALPASP
jgi:hypothetical protein